MADGCTARREREPGEEHQERGPHLCAYLSEHKGTQHVCACGAKWSRR